MILYVNLMLPSGSSPQAIPVTPYMPGAVPERAWTLEVEATRGQRMVSHTAAGPDVLYEA